MPVNCPSRFPSWIRRPIRRLCLQSRLHRLPTKFQVRKKTSRQRHTTEIFRLFVSIMLTRLNFRLPACVRRRPAKQTRFILRAVRHGRLRKFLPAQAEHRLRATGCLRQLRKRHRSMSSLRTLRVFLEFHLIQLKKSKSPRICQS